MEPQASVLAAAMASAAEEARRLAPFLNDLDGWDGSDCDTGLNAAATLAAMASALAALDPGAPFSTAVEACARTAVRQGVGHVGVLLGGVFASWGAVLADGARPTPLVVRRMLCARPAPGCRIDASPAVEEVLAGARAELAALGDTLPDVADIISLCSSQAQIGLVEATSEQTGRIDAGAAVLALVLACLDSATRADPAILESYAVMLADLAALGGGRAPSPAPPPAGRRFTVDIVMQGEDKDCAALASRLGALGARLSTVGHTDLFGLGEWRFHVDTSAPLAARHPPLRPCLCAAGRPAAHRAHPALPGPRRAPRRDDRHRRARRRGDHPQGRAPPRKAARAPRRARHRHRLHPRPRPRRGARAGRGRRLPRPRARGRPRPGRGRRLLLHRSRAHRPLRRGVRRPGRPGRLPAPRRPRASALRPERAHQRRPGGPGRRAGLRAPVRPPARRGGGGPRHGLDPARPGARRTCPRHHLRPAATRVRLLLGSGDDGPYLVASLRQLLSAKDAARAVDLETWDGGQTGPTLLQGVA